MGNDGKTQPFKSPAADGGVIAGDTVSAGPTIPESIGPYRLIERLGEGGMGVVYKAEQRKPIQRIVAVKLIKLGFDSTEVLARFESERQALARMDHPNIAKVLDAGTDDRGRPYFVMEYVPGSPVTKYADENRLTIQQRLELMLQVCDAIGHAHAKAIIHRDIKAGNVLAYTTPEGPRVKVIDFGVAKALTSDRLTDRTFNTARGQAIGTYENMSPEQADGSPDIDTRSDVYSLGVLLYELLSGSKPFDKSNLAKAADAEIRRIIREEEPPRPSTQLSALGDTATKIAQSRRLELDALTRQLKSELDWIPLMALRKERERRYATPQQMADDINNYLAAKPLLAAPDSTAYRLAKFARRNRGPIAAALAIMLALVLGMTGTTIGLVREAKQKQIAQAQKLEAQQQQKRAQEQTEIASAVNNFQTQMLEAADPDRLLGDKVTVLQAISAAAKRLDDGNEKMIPVVEAALRRTIGRTYQSLGRDDLAEPNLRKALQLRRDHLASQDPLISESIGNLASVLREQGRYVEAEPLYREALDIETHRAPVNPEEGAAALNNLALLLDDEGKPDQAQPLFDAALDYDRKGNLTETPQYGTDLLNLAQCLEMQGKLTDAETAANTALTLNRKILPPGHPSIATSLETLGYILNDEGKFPQAVEAAEENLAINRKCLPAGHPLLGNSLNLLALYLKSEGKYDRAESLFREALDILSKSKPPGDSAIAICASNLGSCLLEQKKYPEAESLFKQSVEIFQRSLGPSRELATSLDDLARVNTRQHHDKEAESLYRESLSIYRKVLPAGHFDIAIELNNLATCLAVQGKYADAEPILREALAIDEKVYPAENPTVDMHRLNLARSLLGQNKLVEAEQLFRRGLAGIQKTGTVNSAKISEVQRYLAETLLKEGKATDAVDFYRQAMIGDRLVKDSKVSQLAIARDDLGLGLALQKSGQSTEAEARLREALSIRKQILGPTDPATTQAVAAVADFLDRNGRTQEADEMRTSVPKVPTTSP